MRSLRRPDRPAGRSPRTLIWTLCLALAVLFGRCGGGGGGSGDAFDVVAFSVSRQSPRVYLNDPIEITFAQPVDANTVFSGLHIYPSATAGAVRAQGELHVAGERVIFTPALPTDPQFLSGGFLPNTEYTICLPAPGASCSAHIQHSPGVRSQRGQGLPATRTETFLTVDLAAAAPPFRPERLPQRPAIARVTVHDAAGVDQVLNPIVNLVSGQTWLTGVLTTVAATPATTLVPGTSTAVPRFRYEPTRILNQVVESPFDPRASLASKDPLVVLLSQPSRPLEPDAFRDAGGVLTLRDSSTPPVTASWAIDTNTADRVFTRPGSGPDYDAVPFATPPFTAEVSQGITRQVHPGDIQTPTEIRIVFDEPLDPGSATLASFRIWRVTDGAAGLEFLPVPPASTLAGTAWPGITHAVVDGRSVVTLRPAAGFPPSRPDAPATIVLTLDTAQPENAVAPSPKNRGLRDLNGFALAYPVRAGWVLALDAGGNPTTVASIDELPYRDALPFPANVQVMWAFQTRGDTGVANAIVEDFSHRGNVSPQCPTTAAWTLAGQAGLHATPGYGGNGELGDVVIHGATRIDTSTLPLAPDGVAEFDTNRFTLTPTGTITVEGPVPLRINALQSMLIQGTIDASGRPGNSAPAGAALAVGRLAGGAGGPGAGAGGESNTRPDSLIGALPMELRGGPGHPRVINQCGDPDRSDNRLVTPIDWNCGGGTGGNRGVPSGTLLRSGCSGNGGGHFQPGIQTDFLCGNIGAYGRELGSNWIGAATVPAPTAGTGGGAGGNAAITLGSPSPAADIVAGSGGGGGGGIELVSAGSLIVDSTAQVVALGGSGGQGYTTFVGATSLAGGWGGGGSGGSIWLSGTSVTVNAGASIDASGGKGNPFPPSSGRTGDGGDGYVIIRGRGVPNVNSGAHITPARLTTRDLFLPPRNGLSEAHSTWYDSGEPAPSWAFDASDPRTGQVIGGKDLTWLDPPVQGQIVRISFQGAPDAGNGPNADPTSWYPPGNTPAQPCQFWETDITKLRTPGNLRHVRFKVTFDIGPRSQGAPPPHPVAIRRIVIHHGRPQG
ncbi:MAG: hypothetical protein JXQ29_02725 [Planctomycetes bacterium]|nr:hypothetical protein [Planctomycetota bacterium]